MTKIDEFHFFDNDYRVLASRIRRIQLNDSDESLWPIAGGHKRLPSAGNSFETIAAVEPIRTVA
ncbi:hypothetical protein [Pseudomonas sp. URMO17WK12:I6]|uniref:hypothetical protein n=1 Tax=Pseudomonas sp. URMO17WK12:I6 TaxID=1261629 RepID=UPI0011B6EF8C|nr:hypothetical protein [Pseudomonas sp. URMO17WK12:I6]